MTHVQVRTTERISPSKRKPLAAPKPARARVTVEKEVEDWISHKKLNVKFREVLRHAKSVFADAQTINVRLLDSIEGGEPRVIIGVKTAAGFSDFRKDEERFYAPLRDDLEMYLYLVVTQDF